MSITRVCFVLVALVACQQITDAFDIVNCAKGKASDAELISLSVDSCPDQSVSRCPFVKGTNATMTMQFQPTKTFKQANISIKGKLGRIYIPFAFNGPKDACGNYGFDCPVKVGDKATFKLSLPVSKSYPSLKAAVHFEMTDENKSPILCIEFPVQLKSS